MATGGSWLQVNIAGVARAGDDGGGIPWSDSEEDFQPPRKSTAQMHDGGIKCRFLAGAFVEMLWALRQLWVSFHAPSVQMLTIRESMAPMLVTAAVVGCRVDLQITPFVLAPRQLLCLV